MSEIGSLLLQLAGNRNTLINPFRTGNIAIGYKKFDFSVNHDLHINTHGMYDKIKPECIILTINDNFDTNLVFFQTYITHLVFNFNIDNRNILKIPLSLSGL